MLIAGASALIIVITGAIALLVAIDLRRTESGGRLQAVKQWQSLIGSVLGFLGAAGVLVLGFAIESEQERERAREAAHAIGLGLALEVEKLATGLTFGRDMAAVIDFGEGNAGNMPQTCLIYAEALRRALVPDMPVYAAVLTRMVEFGDTNLAVFVRFYAFYTDFLRAIKEVDQGACNDNPQDEMTYILSQVNGGLGFYQIIADRYDIAPIPPAPAAEPPPVAEPEETGT